MKAKTMIKRLMKSDPERAERINDIWFRLFSAKEHNRVKIVDNGNEVILSVSDTIVRSAV